MRRVETEILFAIVAVPVIAMIAAASWVIPSYYEAQAFNRATESNVSTWDAMFLELRIEGHGSK